MYTVLTRNIQQLVASLTPSDEEVQEKAQVGAAGATSFHCQQPPKALGCVITRDVFYSCCREKSTRSLWLVSASLEYSQRSTEPRLNPLHRGPPSSAQVLQEVRNAAASAFPEWRNRLQVEPFGSYV